MVEERAFQAAGRGQKEGIYTSLAEIIMPMKMLVSV